MGAALLRCTCPRCHGKTYEDIAEYLVDHQGCDVRSHEVSLVTPKQVRYQTFVGDMENGEQVLVQMWPEERQAQVAFRPKRSDTWGPPVVLEVGK